MRHIEGASYRVFQIGICALALSGLSGVTLMAQISANLSADSSIVAMPNAENQADLSSDSAYPTPSFSNDSFHAKSKRSLSISQMPVSLLNSERVDQHRSIASFPASSLTVGTTKVIHEPSGTKTVQRSLEIPTSSWSIRDRFGGTRATDSLVGSKASHAFGRSVSGLGMDDKSGSGTYVSSPVSASAKYRLGGPSGRRKEEFANKGRIHALADPEAKYSRGGTGNSLRDRLKGR